MDWIKKNVVTIAVVLIIIAVIIYFVRRNRKNGQIVLKIPQIPGMAGRSRGVSPEGKTKAELQKQLAECEAGSAGIKLAAGSPHPCAGIRDLLAAAESSFSGPFTETNGLNVEDFSMGLQGMSLLEDRSLESNFGKAKAKPKPTTTTTTVGGSTTLN